MESQVDCNNAIVHQYNKVRVAMKWRLTSMQFENAIRAFYFVDSTCKGHFRKDGVTPTFMHPLSVASHVMTINPSSDLITMDNILASCLLHDMVEDDVQTSVLGISDTYNTEIAHMVQLLSKKELSKGISISTEHQYRKIADNEWTPIIKACDRIHNLSTMVGVFSIEKQTAYVSETVDFILPMLKLARTQYPKHTDIYLNLERELKNTVGIVSTLIRRLQMASTVIPRTEEWNR